MDIARKVGPHTSFIIALCSIAACGDDDKNPAGDTGDTQLDTSADSANDTSADSADDTSADSAADSGGDTTPDTTPAKTVKVYGVDGNLGNFLGEHFSEPGSLLGLSGTIPGSQPNQAFEARLRAIDPDLVDVIFAGEAYDAVVVTALAAEIARSHEGAEIARFVNGVTTRGEKCTSFAACLALVEADADIDYDGMAGPLEFIPQGEPAVAYFAHVRFGADNLLDDAATVVQLAGDAARADAVTPAPPPRSTAPPASALALAGLYPQTGALAFIGPSFSAAGRLAIADINAAGGVNGLEVTLVEADSGDSSSDLATQTVTRLIADGADVIIGAAASGVSRQVIDRVTAAGVLMFSPSNTAEFFTTYADEGLYFRTAPPDSMQARALAEQIVADGAARLGIMALDDPYGTGLAEVLERELTALGIAASEIETIVYADAAEFPGHVSTLQAFDPDAIALIGFDETADIIALLNEAGIGPKR